MTGNIHVSINAISGFFLALAAMISSITSIVAVHRATRNGRKLDDVHTEIKNGYHSGQSPQGESSETAEG